MKTFLLCGSLLSALALHSSIYALEVLGPNDVCPGAITAYTHDSNINDLCRAEWRITGGVMINPSTGARVTSLTLYNSSSYNLVNVEWGTNVSAGRISLRVVECVLGLAFNDSDDVRIGPNTTGLSTSGPVSLASCSLQQGTYSISSVPNGPNGVAPTITWATSTNLRIVSGGNTRNVVVRSVNNTTSGSAWVRPTLNYGNCGGTRTLSSRSIQLNATAFTYSQVSVSGTSNVCLGSTYTYLALVPGGHSTSYTYIWQVPSDVQFVSQAANAVSIYVPNSFSGFGLITVRVNNGCGNQSISSGMNLYKTCGFGGYSASNEFSTYPNPASDQLIIERNQIGEITAPDYQTSKVALSPTMADDIFKVELLNNQQLVVAKGTARENKLQLDTKRLPPGTYFLQIYYKEGVLQKQIIIQ